MSTKYILSPHWLIVQLFCSRGGLEGAIKMIIGTKTDLMVVFLCMKLLVNSTYPIIHSSIIIICYIVILYSIEWQASRDN
jgi:hypothetical protein